MVRAHAVTARTRPAPGPRPAPPSTRRREAARPTAARRYSRPDHAGRGPSGAMIGEAQADAPSAAVVELLGAVVAEMRATMDRVVEDLVAGAVKDLPELRSEVLAAEVTACGRALAEMSIDRFEDPLLPLEVPAPALRLAVTLARREVPLSTLVELFRVGQTVFFEMWLGSLAGHTADAALLSEALAWSYRRYYALIDAAMARAIEEHLRERQRWQSRALARRARVVQGILDGTVTDAVAAGRSLGHDLEAIQLAAVLSLAEPENVAILPDVARELAQRLGVPRALTVPGTATTLHAWIACPHPPDLHALAQVELPPGVCAAVGSPGTGLRGFAASYREARWANQVALQSAPGPSLVTYGSVAALTLVRDDLERTRAFIRHELGGLAEPDEGAGRLRTTLRVLLEEGLNASRAAERLSMHKNSVLYRLHRAEEVRGHAVTHRRFELELALRLLDAFGDGLQK
jgi:DNA-binding PucR family transcriptional regulator